MKYVFNRNMKAKWCNSHSNERRLTTVTILGPFILRYDFCDIQVL